MVVVGVVGVVGVDVVGTGEVVVGTGAGVVVVVGGGALGTVVVTGGVGEDTGVGVLRAAWRWVLRCTVFAPGVVLGVVVPTRIVLVTGTFTLTTRPPASTR